MYTKIVGGAALSLVLFAAALPALPAQAAVKGETVVYKAGDTTLEGYLAYDDAAKGKRPGIVVFPDWLGVTDYSEARARKLAGLGYVVFIGDFYGKGVRPNGLQQAMAEVGKLRQESGALQARYDAALAQLRQNPNVDQGKLVAMGYCFGAQSALGLTRHGADLLATIIFHGDLTDPDPASAKNIKGHVLVFWGANDPYVPPKAIDAFEDEMRATKADWQVVTYANTVHSFTVPSANTAKDAYNPIADQRSWQQMQDFLHDVSGP